MKERKREKIERGGGEIYIYFTRIKVNVKMNGSTRV